MNELPPSTLHFEPAEKMRSEDQAAALYEKYEEETIRKLLKEHEDLLDREDEMKKTNTEYVSTYRWFLGETTEASYMDQKTSGSLVYSDKRYM